MGRYTFPAFNKAPTPRYVVVFGLQRQESTASLEPATDLHAAMAGTIERLVNDGWQAEGSAENDFVFIRRGTERRLLMPSTGGSSKGPALNNLLFFFPRAANFRRPFLVTAPIIEIIGDRGVTPANPLRILRYGCCWFDSACLEACRMEEHLRNSSRSFAVAHLVPR